MKKMKLSFKMILSFGIVLVLMAVIVAMSVGAFKTVESTLDNMHNEVYREVSLADEICIEVNETSNNLLSAALDNDTVVIESNLAAALESLSHISGDTAELRDSYRGDMSYIDTVDAEIAALQADISKYSESCKANNDDEAYTIYMSELAPSIDNIMSAVNYIQEDVGQAADTLYAGASRRTELTI
ncbi:MAG: MCP four helix bundle domain-containing protein, partial [Oscillospiraceae bacterium]